MSGDNDRDHSDYLNGPYVRAACVDCGGDVVTDCDPDGAVCEECCDRRDAHTSGLELRMVKADRPAVSGVTPVTSVTSVPVVVDVALVPVSINIDSAVVEVAIVPLSHLPAGYLDWLDGLRANARYGSDALARAWYIAPVHYTEHLLKVAPDLWLTLKAIARRAA